ncbi:hypothetical protein MMC12_004492 [Toensbergia leucococca]|nr:hypothetical protein [Toensbergia leucococca]
MPLLEVEQKFSFCVSKLAKFKANLGNPPFRQRSKVEEKNFQDVYYDSNNVLSKNGIWLRLRGCDWELKRRVSGSFAKSTFEEVTDRAEIKKEVRWYFPGCPSIDDNFGLNEICRFSNLRQSWDVDKKFRVILDKTDFGHTVGEVEHLAAKDPEKAHADIDDFMLKYAWFFDRKNPKGKLTAYFENYGMPKEQ